MKKITIKGNKESLRHENGHFVKGNKEGHRFRKNNPDGTAGRPKGSKNLMTIVKEVAMAKESNHGKSNIEWILCEMIDTQRKLKKHIESMDENDPRYRTAMKDYQELSVKVSDHLIKLSGDYATKLINEDSDTELTDQEKELIDRRIEEFANKN